MKSRRLLIGSGLALGVLLPMTGAAWLFWDDQPVRRLPDGSTLRLATVQYGIPKPIVTGPTWKRRLFRFAPYLPRELQQRVGWRTYDVSHDANPETLTLGFARSGRDRSSMPVGEFIDRHGCRYRSMNNAPGDIGDPLSNVGFYPFFPRREPSLHVEVSLTDGYPKRVAAFEIGNPVGQDHPVWKPESLPLTRTSGPLEVTLARVTRGWAEPPAHRLARNLELEYTRLDYRLPSRCREWRPVGVSLHDATGGAYRFETYDWRPAPNAVYVRGDNLCREEAAYEYRVEFSRALTGGTPDHVYELGAVTPGTTGRDSLNLPDGRKLHVVSSPEGEPSMFGNWPDREGEVGRLWLVPEDSRARTMSPVLLPGGTPRRQSFNIPVPKGTKRVRLRFGVYQSQFVTFRVKPQWLTSLPPER